MIYLLGNRVLIEVIKNEEKTTGGIILPNSTQPDDFRTGKVISVGEGRKTDNGELIPVGINKDVMVIFQYGRNITVDNKVYSLVNEEDIIMVI